MLDSGHVCQNGKSKFGYTISSGNFDYFDLSNQNSTTELQLYHAKSNFDAVPPNNSTVITFKKFDSTDHDAHFGTHNLNATTTSWKSITGDALKTLGKDNTSLTSGSTPLRICLRHCLNDPECSGCWHTNGGYYIKDETTGKSIDKFSDFQDRLHRLSNHKVRMVSTNSPIHKAGFVTNKKDIATKQDAARGVFYQKIAI